MPADRPTILVLGAGHSAPYLIHHLLQGASAGGYLVTVADRDPALLHGTLAGHPAGRGVVMDLRDADARRELIDSSTVVVDVMPPSFQPEIATDCLACRRHLVSVSYLDRRVEQRDDEARARGVLILAECGLDPGIDLMSARRLVEELHCDGWTMDSFESYGAGLPADRGINPLRYAITWNPRNVVMAGSEGAQFLRAGRLRMLRHERVFVETWTVEVPGHGVFEAYANRDALRYRALLDAGDASTFIRGTLRYPGWCAAWRQVVRLGLATESLHVPGLADWSWSDLVSAFLPYGGPPETARERTAQYLDLPAHDPSLEKLAWLGLFSGEPIASSPATLDLPTPAAALSGLLSGRLGLPTGSRDLVLLVHRVDARRGDEHRRVIATLATEGDPGGFTAMARTVGLPAALAAQRLLREPPPVTGCRIPVDREIWEPLLSALEDEGISEQRTVSEIA